MSATACLSSGRGRTSPSHPASHSRTATNRERGRARELVGTEIDFITNRAFQAPHADHHILGDGPWAPDRSPLAGQLQSLPKGMPAYLARLCEADLLTAEEERDLFRRMNYLKYRANAARATLDPHDPDVRTLRRTEAFLSAASTIRDHLVRANMRLVISVVKKFVTPQLSFDDMLSDGIMTLMNAVDKFDYDRGFRFSTYAYRSIARNAFRAVTDRQKESSRFVNSSESHIVETADAHDSSSMDEKTWENLRQSLSRMLHHLDRRERFIIRGRYALGAHRKVRTFQCLADKLGVSKERVRQLEQRAVSKLRTMAAEINLDELVETAAQGG